MLDNFKFMFKDFKKANKYADIYNKRVQNPFLKKEDNIENIYIWVEKLKANDF